MNLPKQVKVISLIFIFWFILSSTIIFYVREDNGQFAQIAIPFFLGIFHLVMCFLLYQTYFRDYKNDLKKEHKWFALSLILISFLLAFLFIPLYKYSLDFLFE